MGHESLIRLTEEEMALFLAEVDEHLEALDSGLLQLEATGHDADLLNRIFRYAHTLKGSAATAGLPSMSDLAHSMEDVLDRLRNGEMVVSSEVISNLLESLDKLRALREALTGEGSTQFKDGGGQVPGSKPVGTLSHTLALSDMDRANIEAYLAGGRAVYRIGARISSHSAFVAARQLQLCMEAMARGELVASVPSMDDIEAQRVSQQLIMFLATELSPQELRGALTQVDEVEDVDVVPVTSLEDAMGLSASKKDVVVAQERPSGSTDGRFEPRTKLGRTVRIDLERLDNLMNLVGELVITRTRLARIGTRIGQATTGGVAAELVETTTQLARITDQLQMEVTRSRMLPIGTVFSKFPRMVRDLALKAGKRIELIVEGQDTELDRTVIEVVGDPLVHLLRNAIDHGIELPHERVAAGKPEHGTIRLVAYQEEGNIVVLVEDDGRGIDPDKVRKAAVARGVIAPEVASRLTTEEVLDLVFKPGLSTAQQVTEVSGRGVGMDVVRSNIERVNGTVSLESQPGRGTRIELRLPLTLAIIRALLVRASGEVFAIPLMAVREVLRLPRDTLSGVVGRPVVDYRGGVLPLFALDDLLKGGCGTRLPYTDVHLVVVSIGGRQLGLAVDGLVGNQEVVIKALDSVATISPCISGATILDDGTVGLILDAGALLRTALQLNHAVPAEVGAC